MMTAYRGFVVVMLLAVVLLRPSPAAAQLSSRSLPSADPSLAVGQKVSVTTADGRRITGQVVKLSPSTLDIGKGEEVKTSLALADVQRVQAADSVTNGVVIGALSLGLSGLLVGGLADAGNAAGQAVGDFFIVLLGAQPPPIEHTHHYLTGAVAGVALGAVLGYALDSGKEKTIYERGTAGMSVAVHPIVSPAGTGLGLNLRW